jgi:hypothetical protein
MKLDLFWIIAAAAALAAAYALTHRAGATPSSSSWCAGKCQGNTVPGYWADVL